MDKELIISRVDYSIRIMKEAEKLDMRTWQRPKSDGIFCSSIEELHTCGTSACFAGYIAISPLFLELRRNYNNIFSMDMLEIEFFPVLGNSCEENAIYKFLGLDRCESMYSIPLRAFIYGIIYPHCWSGFSLQKKRYRTLPLYGDVLMSEITPSHVIKHLTYLKSLVELGPNLVRKLLDLEPVEYFQALA